MSEANNQDNNRPDYIAYHVQGQGRSANWIKLGAAWNSKDGEGLSVQLDALPFNFDGRLVFRKPKD